MKKEKGFTLIELLAVIVILAILMVIAVPKILNVIENSRKSAAESSIKLVKDAIKTQVSTASMSGTTFEKTGECYLFNFDNQESGNAKTLSLKNKDKIGGSIKYCNGKFESDTLKFEGTSVSGSGNGGETAKVCKRVTREEDLHTKTCRWNDATYYCSGAGYANGDKITYGNLGTKGAEPQSGDAFDCDVNGDETYNQDTERFYYVTDMDDSTAVLIYYNNVSKGKPSNTTRFAYDSSRQNWHGPRTAIEELPSTSEWRNVSLTSSVRNIVTENGTKTTNGGTLPDSFSYAGKAARLLTIQEINKACNISAGHLKGELNNCNYLMENTRYSNSSCLNGYWLESPKSSDYMVAWDVHGGDHGVNSAIVSTVDDIGVRPAIEVSKSNIEY